MKNADPKGRAPREEPPKSSFLGRWTTRVLVLAILLVAGLVTGFKVERGTWAWQDTAAFEAYSLEKWGLVRAKAGEYAHMAKKKADESGLTARTEDLIERAKRALATEDPEPAAEPEEPAAPAPQAAPTAPAKADPAAVAAKSQVPDGYSEEYKAGLEAYREALVHFRDSQPHTPGEQRELRAAKTKFEAARDHWQKAAALYDKDPRLDDMQMQLNQYLLDCNKRLKPTY
jgi:hypothetical protein